MATQLGELVFKITGDNSGIKKSLKDTENSVNNTASVFKKAATTLGAFFAADRVIAFSKYLIKSASDAQETAQKFGVVYSQITADATKSAEALAAGYNMSNQAAQEYLATTGSVLSSFGFTQEAALQYSTQLTALAADLVSFTNYQGGVEGASSALTKALLGEREALKELGVVVSDQDLQQYAKDQGLVWSALDRRRQAELTLQLIMERTKVQQGDVSRSTESYAYNVRRLEANLDNISVLLGGELLGSATTLVKILGDITSNTQAFSEAIKLLGPNWIDFAAPFLATQKPMIAAIDNFGNYLDKMLEKIEVYKKANDWFKRVTGFGSSTPSTPSGAPKKPSGGGKPAGSGGGMPKGSGGGGKPPVLEEEQDFGGLNEYTAQLAAVQYMLGQLEGDAMDAWNQLSPPEKLTASIDALTGSLSILQNGLSSLGELSSAIFASMAADLEAQRLAELEAAGVAEETAVERAQAAYDAALKGGDAEVIKEKKKTLEREKINEKYQKKKNQLEYEAAVVAWDIQMASAVATGAMAVLNAYAAGAKFGPIVAGVYAGIAGVFSGMQIAAVALGKPKPPAYETGGIVPGDSFSGDRVLARVNSGEMILNADQQKTLFDLANGAAGAKGGVIHLVVNLGSKLLYDDIHDATVSRELIIDAGAVR